MNVDKNFEENVKIFLCVCIKILGMDFMHLYKKYSNISGTSHKKP